MTPALAVEDLEVRYRNGIQALRGMTLTLAPGRCLGVVGESGCGKTTLALATLGLLPAGAEVTGSVRVAGTEVVGAPPGAVRALRGLAVGLVAQNPFGSLNPALRVSTNVAEAWRAHRLRPPPGFVARALGSLGIATPERRARARPRAWSGGMLQRAAIAAAAAHHPPLVVADEPTSALDAPLADGILASLCATGAAVLLVSHDLVLVARHTHEVAVLYAGRVVEHGPSEQVLTRPRHPYAVGLVAATPRPGGGLPAPLPGEPPALDRPIPGCAFAPRCPRAEPRCRVCDPPLTDGVACPVVTGR